MVRTRDGRDAARGRRRSASSVAGAGRGCNVCCRGHGHSPGLSMSAERSPVDVVKAHMAAEDRQDIEATMATFTDDCWYSVPSLGVELRGKDQIRGWYEDTFAAVPDFRNADERYWVAG